MIRLKGKQLSLNAHQKEKLLAISSPYIQPTPCHSVSLSRILLGLASQDDLGLASTPSQLCAMTQRNELPEALLAVAKSAIES